MYPSLQLSLFDYLKINSAFELVHNLSVCRIKFQKVLRYTWTVDSLSLLFYRGKYNKYSLCEVSTKFSFPLLLHLLLAHGPQYFH